MPDEALRERDPVFDQLHAEWGGFVEERARSMARNDPEPDDFVQHVWERFFKIDVADLYLHYEGPGNFRIYIQKMIFSTFLNWRRTRERRWRDHESLDVIEDLSDGIDYERRSDARFILRWVEPLVEAFTPDQVIRWRHYMAWRRMAITMDEAEEHPFRIFSRVVIRSNQRFFILNEDLAPYASQSRPSTP
jgi:DNA-directed RNA polymerase specialized sigma24 family protein